MNHEFVVSQSVMINATAEKVWDALINPEIIKEYLYGTETITDWNVGSEIIFQGEYEGHKYRDKGQILRFAPYQLITYTYWSAFSGLEDKSENYSTVTYTLIEQDGQIKFTWTTGGFADEEKYNEAEIGMKAFLEQIKAIIER